MTSHDTILDGERPAIAAGLLVQAATRRQVQAALMAIQPDQFADTIREHLVNRFGAGRADAIINDMARGLLFK